MTPIFFSHPSAASPATQNMRPNMLFNHSCTSPDFTHLGSDSGRSVSRWTIKCTLAGSGTFENEGIVPSVSEVSEIVGKDEYDFVASDSPSICEDIGGCIYGTRVKAYQYTFQAIFVVLVKRHVHFDPTLGSVHTEVLDNLSVHNQSSAARSVRDREPICRRSPSPLR
jgi:hypothetical protein